MGLRCGHAGPHACRVHPDAPLLDETEKSDRIEAVAGFASSQRNR